jgi:hypothetical protein
MEDTAELPSVDSNPLPPGEKKIVRKDTVGLRRHGLLGETTVVGNLGCIDRVGIYLLLQRVAENNDSLISLRE